MRASATVGEAAARRRSMEAARAKAASLSMTGLSDSTRIKATQG
jgi:hypothetical protein